jgi:nucleotide-binding universal stress UspA family protein
LICAKENDIYINDFSYPITALNMSIDNGTFFKILVAIDGSENSMKATEYAIENIAINQKANVQLIVVTVIELNLSTFLTAPTFGLEEHEGKRKQAKEWLSTIEKLIQHKDKNIKFKSDILEDPTLKVSSIIINHAESENVDLIVVGNRGRKGFKRMLLGSVASDIVTYAHCPVLVVK